MGLAIGVMFPGDPTAPGKWSGTPSGIVKGLEELGVEVHGINVEAPRRVSRSFSVMAGGLLVPSIVRARLPLEPSQVRSLGRVSPAVAKMRSAVAWWRLRDAAPLDGLIQIHTGYTVRSPIPLVTFEDMTTVQLHEAGWAQWRALPPRALVAHVRRRRAVYQHARACCASTHWAARSMISDYGVPEEKLHVVGIGRNFDPLGAVARSWSPPRFLFVGLDWERKNGARVLAAFARLRAVVPEAQLDVVGNHPPLHAEGLVGHGHLRLASDVERARLADLFANATCFVMPSIHEPAGLAYVEAAASGIPSIGTANGGAREFVGEGGLIVDPLDDDGLLEAMRTLCDPATAARLGRMAQERSALFTSRTLAGRLLRALDLPSCGIDDLPAFL